MAFKTIQVQIDPNQTFNPDKRFWKFALFNEDGTPYSPPNGSPGTGIDGASAYQIAVDNGFVGTQSEWLSSLAGTSGSDGASAYEVAVANGFSGTQSEWLGSLIGPEGPSGQDGADGVDGLPIVPDWAPNTFYLANQLVRAPDLSLVRANINFTSGAVYNPANWTKLLSSSGFVGYQEVTAAQANISARTDITGLALPTFTVLTNEVIWVEAFCPYFTATAAGAQSAINFARNEDSSLHSTVFSGQAPVANGQCSELITKWRISIPGDYTVRGQVQKVGTGTITVNSSASAPSYIRAYREQ